MTTETRITAEHHDLDVLDRIFISRYNATDDSAMVVADLIIVEVREKAIKVQHERVNISCWFPKKALVIDDRYKNAQAMRVASWFAVSEWYTKLEDHVGAIW
jgi:hypothetical protein